MLSLTPLERRDHELGYERGLREGLQLSIRVSLETKFGVEGLLLVRETYPLRTYELEAVLKALKTAKTLDELRRVWPKREDETPRFPWSRPGMPQNYSLDDEEVAILHRLIRPDEANLSVSTSRDLLKMGFDPQTLRRIQELAERVRDGTVTAEEKAEIGCYERAGYLFFLLHDKARRSIIADGALP
jgi:hypothetical protein